MKNQNALVFGLRLGSAVSALFAEILQLLAILLQYDNASNYFAHGAKLPTIAVICAVIGVVLGIVAAVLTDPKTLPHTVFSDKPCVNPASVGFLAAAVCMVVSITAGSASVWSILFIVSALLATVYTVCVNLPTVRRSATAVAFVGFFSVISCILLCAYYYFDLSLEMNAPLKTMVQLGVLATMIYFTAEIRFLLGNGQKRVFLALSFALVSIGALSSLAVPIAFLAGRIDRIDYLAGALLTLSVELTATLRIYHLLKHTTTGKEPT